MGKVTWFELGIFSVASLLAALLVVGPMAGSLASLYMKLAPAITEAYFYETLVILLGLASFGDMWSADCTEVAKWHVSWQGWQ